MLRGFRHVSAVLFVFTSSLLVSAAPPEVSAKLPAKVGFPVVFEVKVEAGKAFSFAAGFDRTKCTVVRLWSEDATIASFLAIPNEPGQFYVTFWTRGEKESGYSQTVIDTGTSALPIAPPPKPKDPPLLPPASLYFVIVGADGPAQPAVTTALALPQWATLTMAGHKYTYKTATEAAALGIRLPAGTALPCVVALRGRPDGKSSQLSPVQALPSNGAAVLALPEAYAK